MSNICVILSRRMNIVAIKYVAFEMPISCNTINTISSESCSMRHFRKCINDVQITTIKITKLNIHKDFWTRLFHLIETASGEYTQTHLNTSRFAFNGTIFSAGVLFKFLARNKVKIEVWFSFVFWLQKPNHNCDSALE